MGRNQKGSPEEAASKKAKKKKEKITYIDDGSTVADMSSLRGKKPPQVRQTSRPGKPGKPGKAGKPAPTTRSGQIWQTYKDAVRAMIGPMLIFIAGMSIVFFLVWLILGFFA